MEPYTFPWLPWKGSCQRQLTEGSRLGLWPSLAAGAFRTRCILGAACRFAVAFLKKSRTPQTRLSPGQLPFQGSHCYIIPHTSARTENAAGFPGLRKYEIQSGNNVFWRQSYIRLLRQCKKYRRLLVKPSLLL